MDPVFAWEVCFGLFRNVGSEILFVVVCDCGVEIFYGFVYVGVVVWVEVWNVLSVLCKVFQSGRLYFV